eukprot:scaffold32995_cov55-Phaeocystis_antarctica.AAC.3
MRAPRLDRAKAAPGSAATSGSYWLCTVASGWALNPNCVTCCRAEDALVVALECLAVHEARGSDCACESDGGDSDGQGTPQGGGGVRSTPPSGSRSGNFSGV